MVRTSHRGAVEGRLAEVANKSAEAEESPRARVRCSQGIEGMPRAQMETA